MATPTSPRWHSGKTLTIAGIALGILAGVSGVLIGILRHTQQENLVPNNLSEGIVLQREGLDQEQEALEKTIAAAPPGIMKQNGLAGAMGGIHVKLSATNAQEVLLPMPQWTDSQVPLAYAIATTPPNAAVEIRLRKRDGNDVVSVRLAGNNQDVRIAWSAVVLLARGGPAPNITPPDPYRTATGCVQSSAGQVAQLAASLWPETAKASDLAANIQRHIRAMKKKEQPRSLDALGILQSGENSICTSNANLATALMRSKGIACRTMAVIPTISMRLEMHRIVEYYDEGRWVPFDPSSLQADIPAQPWQNIVMCMTTPGDEELAMKPRMSSMVGSPFGQEVEMMTSGISLFGQDFFWTVAKPLAQFEPTDEALRLATGSWTRYLETGVLSSGQRQAAHAKSAADLVKCLKME